MYILCTLHLQPYHTVTSKPSPSTSTFIVKGPDPMPQQSNSAHGNLDVTTTSTPNPTLLHAVPKYVTDVAELISASAETRKMFLTEVTRTCLEAAKRDKTDSYQMTSLQLGQPITNLNTTSKRPIFSTSSSSNTATKPVTIPVSIHQALR